MPKNSFDFDGVKKFAELKKEFREGIRPKDAKGLADLVIAQIKDVVSKGLSPIRGFGRYEGYKNPDKYPGDRKSKRPVNLRLTGQMLDSLTHKVSNLQDGFNVSIFYGNKLAEDKEKGHRQGVNKQPKRPVIPVGNEEIAVSIERTIVNYVKSLIKPIR